MPIRKDCTPDAEIPEKIPKTRRYTGPAKGSDEAKARMAKVREAQWAKNGLISASTTNANNASNPARA